MRSWMLGGNSRPFSGWMIAVVFGLGQLAMQGLPVAVLAAGDSDRFDFFEARIRPVLSKHCYTCHSAAAARNKKLKGGLRLDSRAGALRGGDSGPVLTPGKPGQSLLIAALAYEDLEMPPQGKLSPRILADFKRWVADGAAWPPDKAMSRPEQAPDRLDYAAWRQKHWAWRPLDPTPPPAADDRWARGPIDRFIAARLRTVGLQPSPVADRATLYRRLHFDLLGIPPRYAELRQFVEDTQPDAYARLVDRLLASPAYGEKWGRHWLDIARYADNGGFNSQTKELYTDFPYAYSYRDYVVRAFNEDLPYDQFVMEQLAADKLPRGNDNRHLAALGFLSLGDKSFGTSSADRVDDCIDTVTRGLLGTTVSCARCHDHKYDPIPTADYYSLFNVFQNTTIDVASRLHTPEKSSGLPILYATATERTAHEAAMEQAQRQLELLRERHFAEAQRHVWDRISDYLLAAENRAGGAQQKGLSKELIKHWKTVLRSKSEAFVAWRVFAGLPRNAGPQRYRGKLAELGRPGQAGSVDPIVSRLFSSAGFEPPQTLADVAQAYARLIRSLRAEIASGRAADNKVSQAFVAAFGKKESPLKRKRDEMLRLPIHSGASSLAKANAKLRQLRFERPRAVAVKDKPRLQPGFVYIRGNPGRRGRPVPRRFLALLSAKRTHFSEGSGRLELARAIVDPQNPLTPRVIANRIWRQLLGRGLVNNPSDFGLRSDPPSHPRLLDYLAARLIAAGWSLKTLQREIVLSHTYRQASLDREEGHAIDQENRLLWKSNRRRLDFESLRDSLLAVTGELDARIGGRPVDVWQSKRRTLYGYVNRYRIAPGYMTFDFPSTLRTSPKRTETLIPQQSLFLMNSPFVLARAERMLASRAFRAAPDDASRLHTLYSAILSRKPSAVEREAAMLFLSAGDQQTTGRGAWVRIAHALLMSNEFLYVD